MAGTTFDGIQESMAEASTQVMQQAGQDILNKIEGLALNSEQREQVGEAFSTAVEQAEQTTTNDVGGLTDLAKEKLKEQLNNINILPEEMKEKISTAGNELIDKVHDLAIEALGHATAAATEVAGDIMKQVLTALKSTFKELGALLKGEKSQEQVMDNIKNAWKEAGKEVAKSAGQAKQSFAEKFSSNKDKTANIQKADPTKSHAEKATASKNAPQEPQR